MDYESFALTIMEELQQHLDRVGATLYRHEVMKNNGVVKDAISARYPDSHVAPTVYLNDLFELHKDGYSVSELVDTTMDNLERHKKAAMDMPFLTAESARQNLYCTVVNTAENAEMLKNAPHEKLEDLSVVARFRVGEDGSFLVTNDLCKTLQMTSEEVMEAAHANSDKEEYTCQSMTEVLREMMLGNGMPEDYVDEMIRMEGDQCPMWVLSNESKVDGAVAIASQDTLKAAHEKLGEDYYVLPSSRHEVILVPQSAVTDVEDLKQMVQEVNATEVRRVDKLSDSVYTFNGRRLSLADAPAENHSEAFTESLSKGHSHSH